MAGSFLGRPFPSQLMCTPSANPTRLQESRAHHQQRHQPGLTWIPQGPPTGLPAGRISIQHLESTLPTSSPCSNPAEAHRPQSRMKPLRTLPCSSGNSCDLPATHRAAATRDSWTLRAGAKQGPASGPQHWLLSLCGAPTVSQRSA